MEINSDQGPRNEIWNEMNMLWFTGISEGLLKIFFNQRLSLIVPLTPTVLTCEDSEKKNYS